jgi:hypothetical protein
MGYGVHFPTREAPDLPDHSASVSQERIATRPIVDGDGVTHSPKLGRLGGSHLALGTRHLNPPGRRRVGSRDVVEDISKGYPN